MKKGSRPAGFEPATPGLEGRCSIQLSYGRQSTNASIHSSRRVRQRSVECSVVRPLPWLFVAFVIGSSVVMAFDYADERSKAVKACEAIDRSQYQSGLYGNPDGYRSFYLRSQCLQEAAVLFRDSTLCERVRERRSLLSSSWGYAPARCRQLVAEGSAADRAALEGLKRGYAVGGIRLRDFRVERNGNGRDLDIVPAFTGTFAHGYTLIFEILPDSSGASFVLYTSGYYLDEKSNLRIYVRQADIKQRFSGFSLNHSYTTRATVTLDVGFGGPSGYWSPAFVGAVFPTRERSQSLTRQVAF